jgi:tetratricopeptide (TPR) repeat protein
MAGFDRRWLLALLPGLLLVALHGRTLSYGFVWTDHAEIEVGTLIRPPAELAHAFLEPMHRDLGLRFAGASQPYYRPLHSLVASVVHSLAGLVPTPYRAVSLALGGVTLALFFVLAWQLLGRPGPALFAAAVPALHPAGVEVYVWIAGMSQALSALFIVASLLAALRAMRSSAGAARRWAGCSLLARGLALLSHENGVVTPGLLLALILGEGVSRRAGSPRRGIGTIWPRAWSLLRLQLIVTILFLAFWRPFVLGGFVPSGTLLGESLVTQWLSAVASWPRAFAWLCLPLASSTSDRIRIVDSAADVGVWLGLLILVGSLVVWVWAFRAGRPAAVLGLAWVWIAYLPAANLIPAAHPWAERYVFLSVFGLALVAADLGRGVVSRVPGRAGFALGALLALAVLGGLAQRSGARAPDWRSDLALFERDVAGDPLYREGRFELASQLYWARRLVDARRMLQPLLPTDPAPPAYASFLREPDAWELDCRISVELGEPAQALGRYRELQRARPGTAARAGVRLCAGLALEQSGRPAEALALYRELATAPGVASDPSLAIARARSLAALGRVAEARAELEALDPSALGPDLEREAAGLRQWMREGRGRRGGRPVSPPSLR